MTKTSILATLALSLSLVFAGLPSANARICDALCRLAQISQVVPEKKDSKQAVQTKNMFAKQQQKNN